MLSDPWSVSFGSLGRVGSDGLQRVRDTKTAARVPSATRRKLSVTSVNGDPSRLTGANPLSREPLAHLAWEFGTTRWTGTNPPRCLAGPAVGSRNHSHDRWPAAALLRASNSPQSPCFTKPYLEAAASYAPTGSCGLGTALASRSSGERSSRSAPLARGSPDFKSLSHGLQARTN